MEQNSNQIVNMDWGFPWNGNPIVDKQYEEDNYRITETKAKGNKCIIFFSGNGLYFPNDVETFNEKIIEKDRYEWENVANFSKIVKSYKKIIFLRDIYKQWYLRGINAQVNTIDKVVDLLHELTETFEVVTCGNSAGGYMALYMGAQLKASKIFSFSGQFDITSEIGNSAFVTELQREYGKIYNLSELIKPVEKCIYYFYPANCSIDMKQNELCKDITMHRFAIDEENHGTTVHPLCYNFILSCGIEELNTLEKEYLNKCIDRQQLLYDTTTKYERFSWLINYIRIKTFRKIKRVFFDR